MPAHNLADTIADNLGKVHATLDGRVPFEIVAIDDGSADRTADGIRRAAAHLPSVRPVLLESNFGKGGALRQGFEASRGTHVLLLDADLDLPPDQALGFFSVMARERADIVIGSKLHPRSVLSYPWHRRLASTLYFWLVKALIGLPVRDTQTGMKLFRREPLEWAFARMLVKQFAFDLEVLAIVHERGYRIAEAPVRLNAHATWGYVRPRAVRQVVVDTLAIFYRLRLLHYYQTLQPGRVPNPPPKVSVVVATPAPTPYLDECLGAIARQDYANYEVILLPDEPSGRAWPERVREKPTGRIRPAHKRNAGIREATGEIVAFVDDDAYPAPDWLRHAVGHFSDPAVAGVGGPASTPGSDPYMARLSGKVFARWCVSGKYRYRYEPGRVQDVDDFPSCNLFVRTDVLRAIGGFRTEFWPGEDTYLCLDIVRGARRRIVYDPRVHVYHHRRRLFLPHLRQVGRYALHRGYFARRFPATSRRLSYMMPSFFVAGVLAGAAASLFFPVLRPGYLAGLAAYAVATFACSIHPHPASWFLIWLGVMSTHAVYGARFVVGLCARRMPGEVAAFDHPSERPPPQAPPRDANPTSGGTRR
jgi:glycosyltransferase involved in cell wall biosynthesis